MMWHLRRAVGRHHCAALSYVPTADQGDGIFRSALGEDVLAALYPLPGVQEAYCTPVPAWAGELGVLQWLEHLRCSAAAGIHV